MPQPVSSIEPLPNHAHEPGSAPSRAGIFERVMSGLPPPLLVLLAILCIQVGAAFAVQLFPRLGPTGTVCLRIGLSALLLVAAARPRLNAAARRHAPLVLLFGLLLAVMNLAFYHAIARLPLGVAVTIEFLGPLSVAVATSRRGVDFLWISLALAGLVLLTPAVGADVDPLGVTFAVAAGAAWAGFIVVGRRIGGVLQHGDGLTLGMCVASILLLPFMIIDDTLLKLDVGLFAAGLLVALLATTIPISFEFAALKRMPARAYAVLVTLEPATAMLVGAVLLGQGLGVRDGVAMVLVTAAAIGMTRGVKPG